MLKHLLIMLLVGSFGCEGSITLDDDPNNPIGPGSEKTDPDPEKEIDPKLTDPVVVTRGAGLRRLNVDEIRNATLDTFVSLLPEGDRALLVQDFAPLLPKDGNLGGFSTVGSALSTGSAFTEQYLDILIPVAQRLAAQVPACTTPLRACATTVLETPMRTLFRRTPTAEELGRVLTVVETTAAAENEQTGMAAGFMALLASPQFLFVSHDADISKTRPLTGQELATKLSLTLWLSVPDDALLSAVENDSLTSDEGLNTQIDRMMKDPKFDRFITHFAERWLKLNKLEQPDITPDAFGISEAELAVLAADLSTETTLLFRHILENNLPLSELFTAKYSFINQRLANHYGITANLGEGFERVDLPPERAGLLTQGGWIAQATAGDHASLVSRGVSTLAGFLCFTLPDPDDSLADKIAAQNESPLSEHELMLERGADGSCSGCHSFIDPAGFVFNNYDGLGRYVPQELNTEVELLGETFSNPIEFAEKFQDHESFNFQSCFTSRFLLYSVGRVFDPNVNKEDAALVKGVVTSDENGPTPLKTLIVRSLTDQAFTERGPEVIEGALK